VVDILGGAVERSGRSGVFGVSLVVRRRRGQQKMRWLDGITDSMDMNENACAGKERQDPCISLKH